MITKVTTSVEEMRKNLTSLEKSVDEKFESMQQKVTSIESDTNKALHDIGKLKLQEEYDKSEKAQVETKLKTMKNEIHELKDLKGKMETQINDLRKEMQQQLDEQAQEIKSQRADLKGAMETVENEVDRVKIRSYGNSNQIRHHSEQIEGLDKK